MLVEQVVMAMDLNLLEIDEYDYYLHCHQVAYSVMTVQMDRHKYHFLVCP